MYVFLRDCLKFFSFNFIYLCRRRLPLYADDRSKIFTHYAVSLLNLSTSPYITSGFRKALWTRYAAYFIMPISVSRFHKVISANPAHYFRSDVDKWMKSEGAQYFKHQLNQHIQAHAMFRPLETKEQSQFNEKAYFILSQRNVSEATLSVIKEVKNLTVFTNNKQDKSYLETILKKQFEVHGSLIEQNRNYICLADELTAPYSLGQIQASNIADDIGHQTAQFLTNSDKINLSLPDKALSEISVLISDLCYRFTQNLTGLYLAIKDMPPNSNIILSQWRKPLADFLVKTEHTVNFEGRLFTSDDSISPYIISLEKDDRHNKAISTHIRQTYNRIHTKLETFLSKNFPPSEHETIYILCNRRSSAYRHTVEKIYEGLRKNNTIHIIDTSAAESPLKAIFKQLGANFTQITSQWTHKDRQSFNQVVHECAKATISKLNLPDNISIPDLIQQLELVLNRNFGHIAAHILLYKKLKAHLAVVKNAQAILTPGRDPTVRIMARAFQDHKFMTTDVQVLFVSKMPRYITPIADKIAVIDENTRQHYISYHDIPSSKIHKIGSINLFDDLKEANSHIRSDVYQTLLSAPDDTVITYALQPLPWSDIIRSLKWITEALKDNEKLRLILKMHPAQSNEQLLKCKAFLERETGLKSGQRWAVIHRPSINTIMAITDILLTHYSNVALLAPNLKVPVLALPVAGRRPEPTLEEMGLAIDVSDKDDFHSKLNKILNDSPEKTANFSLYLQKNPHMVDMQPIKNLSELLRS